ncbi:MAG: hypothetical protein M3X11_13605, partial [Acidobacteriota bacterium]|nr:hypothetical protein [Acidobacteriota bacterium]
GFAAAAAKPSAPSAPGLETKDLTGELSDEHRDFQKNLKFTEGEATLSGELVIPSSEQQVHPQVHRVNHSNERAGALGALGVHPFAAPRGTNQDLEDREVI